MTKKSSKIISKVLFKNRSVEAKIFDSMDFDFNENK